MSACEKCFGLGWIEKYEKDVDNGEVFLEECSHVKEPQPLWLTEKTWDGGYEANAAAWADAEEQLEAFCS